MNDDAVFRRLWWRCRRGLLELDVVLQGFIETHYRDLGDEELGRFADLLESPDQQLLDWLHNGAPVTDDRLKGIVTKVRQYADNKSKKV